MDPVTTINEALAALDALLNIINAIRGQGGMTDDQIVAAAQSLILANQTQIVALLGALPLKP
jgi:hypothetical protein